MSWRQLEQGELLSHETVITDKMAGAFVKLSDYNLRSLSYLNWAGTEKIGGKLHLTNYRLVFTSNSFNRVVGTFSIFLPTILEITNTSFLVDRRIEIRTQAQVFEFQIWGIPEFTARIVSTRDSIDAKTRKQLARIITKEYPKLGEDFKTSGAAMIKVVEGAASFVQILEGLSHDGNPLRKLLHSQSAPTISSILNVVEMLGDTKKE